MLARPWQEWLADNLAHGLDDDELLTLLEERGVAHDEATRAIAQIRSSPAFAVAQRLALRSSRLAMLLQLVRERVGLTSIERRCDPDPGELFDRYWATGTPFVATDVVPRWPAFGRWTPQWLRDHFGDVEIEASVDRERDRDYDINFAAHRASMRMADYVDRVCAAGDVSNDCYLIANNHNLARPGLRPLLDDLVLPPYLDPARLVGSSALWFGPAGTTTSLHHDTSNILLGQVLGRKRVWLCDACEPAWLAHARGVYCDVDPRRIADDPELATARVYELDLAAGEALFLPAGWWHQVVALDVSISVGLNNFRRPNRLDWYKPGALR